MLDVDDATVSYAERATRRAVMYRDLAARVMREPGVRGASRSRRYPGMDHGRGPIEVDGVMSPDRVRPQSYTALVAPEFFRELDVLPIAGRVFQDAMSPRAGGWPSSIACSWRKCLAVAMRSAGACGSRRTSRRTRGSRSSASCLISG